MTTRLNQTWDLESIFPGGSTSPALVTQIETAEASMDSLRRMVAEAPLPDSPAGREIWHQILSTMDAAFKGLGQCFAFLNCLIAQDVTDQPAKLLRGRLYQTGAAADSIWTEIRDRFHQTSNEDWQSLMADPRFAPVAFPLDEARDRARRLMDVARESLAGDLATDGPAAWHGLHQTLAGRLVIPVEIRGQTKELSLGQANNLLSDPDRATRARVFASYEAAFTRDAELFAAALNGVGGFRLTVYRHRGWSKVLQEPLELNRMTEATLQAMWAAASSARNRLSAYLRRKARLLGTDAMAWYDLSAPLGGTDARFPYDDAAAFVVEHFGSFSPGMADFAHKAFTERWIEAEDRPGKRAGGFCTELPVSAQSRIFMTYGGQRSGVRTLAHELGHAYHNYVMTDLPAMVQEFSMSVAETASTFAEMIVNAAVIRQAKDPAERIPLLSSTLDDAVTYLMNIQARFRFETRFYEQRRRGPVGVEALNELMLQAQREAYGDSLGQYHSLLWASRHHFYRNPPFYNFPYTFGYLFSAGIYAQAGAEGTAFAPRYVNLLRDTGRMTVEDLAARHLGIDLTQPAFWQSAVDAATAGLDEFLRLTEVL